MKYNFTYDTSSLIITLDTENGKYKQDVMSLNNPSIILGNNSISVHDSGVFKNDFRFLHIGTIDGQTPSDVIDASNKIQTIINQLYTIKASTNGGAIIPSSTPQGTGSYYWTAVEAGTYANFGGFILANNEFAIVVRDAVGAFSISKTGLDLSSYQKKSDNVKIEIWTAKTYAIDNQVNYLGKDWVSNAAVVAGDVPGTSSKWVERLSGYLKPADIVDNVNSSSTSAPLSAAQGKKTDTKLKNSDNSVSFSGTLTYDTTALTVSCDSAALFTRGGYKGVSVAQSVPLISDYCVVYFDSDLLLKCVAFGSYVDTDSNIIISRLSKNGILKLEYSCSSSTIYNGTKYNRVSEDLGKVNKTINNGNFQIVDANNNGVNLFNITTDETAGNCTINTVLLQYFSHYKFAQVAAQTLTFTNQTSNLYLILNLTTSLFRLIGYATTLNKFIAEDDVVIAYISYRKMPQQLNFQAFYDDTGITWNTKKYKYGKEIVSYDAQLTTIKGYQRLYEFTNNVFKFTVDTNTQRLTINGNIQFFSMNKTAGNSGYIYAENVAQSFDFTTDYNYLMFDPTTKLFFFKFYNTFSQTELQNYILLGTFYITKTNCYGQLYSGNKFSINGIDLQSGDSLNLSITSSFKYGELGDSITDKDSKYETNVDYTGDLTGYQGKGYGRYLCDKLKVSYENHFPQGKNGRTTADYWDEIVNGNVNFPTDIDLYTSLLGTNDWGTERHPLGTKNDYLNDTYSPSNRTSYGAYRKIIEHVFGLKSEGKKTPKIILMTPLQRGVFGYLSNGVPTGTMKSAIKINETTNEYEYVSNSYGFTLKDVADMVIWIADREGLGLVDYFNKGFIEKRNLNMAQTWTGQPTETNGIYPKAYQDLLYDNLHPTDKGHRLIASGLLEEINKKFSKFTI